MRGDTSRWQIERPGSGGGLVANLYILPDQKLVTTRRGEKALDAALRTGVPFTHACGGDGRCSTCRVVVVEGLPGCSPRSERERRVADRLGFPPELRLACQMEVGGDVTVRRLVIDERDRELADIRPRVGRGRGFEKLRRMLGELTPSYRRPRPIGDERRVALLFADIRAFTPFAEALLPFDVIHVLERYLDDLTATVQRHGGDVTSYMGDGLMAVFGASDVDRGAGTPSRAAVAAGLEILDAVDRRREVVERLHGRSFEVNVGIHTGDAIVGALWGDRSHVTAIGDAVNLASRIEEANKDFGTRLLVSAETYEDLAGAAVVGRTVSCAIPGKSGEFTLYEVVDLRDRVEPEETPSG